jgi:uncharacterized protein
MLSENNVSNRLINEKSPYLLQHAHNPVDWYPWGDEAFEEAKHRDVPVFLSIGYSSCHWCHVMERECFEDNDVASLLNAGYVCIKVDREERPDVDHLYMEACMALTGSGGWPLTCFLDHDRRPFYAGTYFPKGDRRGMPGLMGVLDNISQLWSSDRKKITSAAQSITQHMDIQHKLRNETLGEDSSEAAYTQLEQSFDPRYGGFGSAPKFPSAHNLLFLLRYGLLNPGGKAFAIVRKTLDCMASGGIFDHIGGGFCRYSTDTRWLVPHFEKMLYDNAMLAMAYCEASAAFNNSMYAEVVQRIVEYCTREMLGSHGGFFTAQDADSEGVEGKYYLWKPGEIVEILGEADGGRFCGLFDISQAGNFEGQNIPNLIGRAPSEEDRSFMKSCFSRLLERRLKRPQPFKDDKVLSSSNGLMVAALAQSGRLLQHLEYTSQAERTAQFLLDNLVKEGRLMSSWREGGASHKATSDDYAYLIWGLFELYQALHIPKWLKLAIIWTDKMLSLFWDEKDGGLFLSGSDVKDLLLRQKNMHDGALPCGNSIAALNLLRLARVTGNEDYENKASAIMDSMAQVVNSYPSGSTALLMTSLYLQSLGTEVVIANGKGLCEMLKPTEAFLPFSTVSVRGSGYEEMNALAPAAVSMEAKSESATAYLCSKGACQPPVVDPQALADMLKSVF